MAWWDLSFTGKNELTDDDREHIAKLITEGFTGGQLNDNEGEDEE